ncbi:glycosyltransferase [Mangrovivirga sp. M17]|uniref:Glycosyltransferase n=1 Tax=Mangrovivirga halotolerans TaxID=2993936 RepID=A0ABT3RP64_9BACT|nr:glycosyltransferase [Mangrovivirga halotolerans]MCX2743400.1 glycosyltransferase [Mangrovivirga halotolerans]
MNPLKTIFVFAYYSYKDPVFQSAVLPYLLKESDNYNFILLTWEQKEWEIKNNEKIEIEKFLSQNNITWKAKAWHSGRFKLFKKIYDFTIGLLYSLYLIYKYNCSIVYSEGFPGCIVGHYISKLSFTKHVIHTFEPHADYMLDAGVWSKKSWEYKLNKRMEKVVGKGADKLITGTENYKEILRHYIKTPIQVIPSCIDTDFYNFNSKAREIIREKLGIVENDIVIVYLGKLGGMYMKEEIFKFFSRCLLMDENFYLLLMTNESESSINNLRNEFRIPDNRMHTGFVKKDNVPDYLSASDIAFCGIRPIPSRRYSSPIKTGEYLSCGLPVIIPEGISDDSLVIEENDLGIVFQDLEKVDIKKVIELKKLDRSMIRAKGINYRSLKNAPSLFEI